MVQGHAHPAIGRAISERYSLGTHFAAPTEDAIVVGEELSRRWDLPRWRYTNSGSESTMDAIRIARAYTKRETIMKIFGSYHGHHDGVMVSIGVEYDKIGDRFNLESLAYGAGIPQAVVDLTIAVPFNDLEATERRIEALIAEDRKPACVIMEAAMMNLGIVLPEPGYLEGMREITQRHGIVLIFDEVKTGLCIAAGGATERWGVKPDMVTLAKALGGGLPSGAIGGTEEVMSVVEDGSVFQVGTFNGNPLGMAASRANLLEVLTPDAYTRLDELNERILKGCTAVIEKHNLPGYSIGAGSKGCVTFSPEKIVDYETFAANQDADLAELAWLFNMNRGIFMTPGREEEWTLSVTHTDESIDTYVACSRRWRRRSRRRSVCRRRSRCDAGERQRRQGGSGSEVPRRIRLRPAMGCVPSDCVPNRPAPRLPFKAQLTFASRAGRRARRRGRRRAPPRRRDSTPSIASRAPPTVPMHRRAAERAQRLRVARHDERAGALAEQQRLAVGRAAAPRSTRAPRPPARQHSASATASPPSATSWAERSAPARTPWRTAAWSVRSSPRSACGQLAERRLAAQLRELGAGGRGRPRAGRDDGDDVALLREAEAARALGLRQLADQPDDRGREDRAGAGLVVERHVAADDRDRERAAGVGEARDGARELPGDVRLLRVAEVEAVGQPERLGADAGEVGRALEHGLDRAAVGVAGDAAAVAVDRDGDRAAARQREHRGVGRLGAAHGARADEAVVLLERPAARGEVGGAQQRDERGAGVERADRRGRRRVHRDRSARPARARRPGTRRPAR